MTVVLAISIGLLLLGIVLCSRSARTGALLGLCGSLCLTVVGISACAGFSHPALELGGWLGFGQTSLRVDGLSGIFLALTGLTASAVAMAFSQHRHGRTLTALSNTLVLSTTVTICVNQAFVFFMAWEGLTVCLYLIAGAERERPGALVSGYFTGALSKIGGGLLLMSFGLLYGHTHSFRFSDWAAAVPHMTTTSRAVVFVLLLAAFSTKIGALPFQGALPVGYSAAPGASAAAISVALSAGYYGLWRLVFDTIGPASPWWGEVVLVLGSLTALAGILYAIAQDDLKRFLGFSTIEHSGIALIGFGVALLGQAFHAPQLAAAGLLACTLHVIAHGLAKTLAFLSADRLERASGQRVISALGGLASRLRLTATGFGLATLTLAAIPPFAGFVSEWFTFEALLQGFRLHSSLAQFLMALSAALLALTAGLGLLAFAKVYGFVFLGRLRSALYDIRELKFPGFGMVALTLVTLGLGPAAPWEILWLGRGLTGSLGLDAAATSIKDPLVLGPVYKEFSVLAPTWLAVSLLAYAIAASGFVWVFLRRPVRRAPVWVTGSCAPLESVQYRASAYSNPIRVVLSGLYGYSRNLRLPPSDTNDKNSTPVLETRMVPAIEHYLYRPITRAALLLANRAKTLQSGRLGAYLLYILAVLLVVLSLIPTLR
jgi:hydrogenase-4 component B